MNEYYPDNVLKIPSATPETSDAKQYIIRHKRKQYNLCGEFCVAYVVQDEAHTDNIDDFLNYWEVKEPKWYASAFPKGLGRTTGIYDLEKMLSSYGVVTPCHRFYIPKPTARNVEEKLVDFQAIIGVQIDYTGYLVAKGIPHWVVLDRINVIDDLHAICDVYNPYTNAIEPYTWKEVMTSTGAYKQGIWINRA